MGLQIERFACFGGQANEAWDIIRDSSTGGVQFVSAHNQKCWDNRGAVAGGPLTQSTCNLVAAVNKTFYLEFQGFVPNCGGALTQKVCTYQSTVSTPDSLDLGKPALIVHPPTPFNSDEDVVDFFQGP